MIPFLFLVLPCFQINGVGMYQRAQGTPIDHQPWNEGSELRWCEEVDFKHGDWMWTNGFIPECIDPKFRDYGKLKLAVLG